MRIILSLVLIGPALLATAGCVEQPASAKQIAGIEATLAKPSEGAELLAMVARRAKSEGLNFVDASREWSQMPPDSRRTIYAAIYEDPDERDLDVVVDNGDAPTRPWIMFLRGVDQARATRVRVAITQDIRTRWPDALDVPVMPSGAFPLRRDLRVVNGRYEVAPDAVGNYRKQP